MKVLSIEECLALLDRAPYQPADWYEVHGKRLPKDGRASATANAWAVDETAKLHAAQDKVEATLRSWIARGDGIAVYQNEAFDSVAFGHKKFNPWPKGVEQPPERLPDTRTASNWAYLRYAGVPPKERA